MTFSTSSLRATFRSLWRSPLFTLTALLTLALGVGANSAVFTLMDRVLFNPLPGVKELDRLAFVDVHTPARADWAIGVNPGDFYLFQREMREAAASGAWANRGDVTLQSGSEPAQSVPLVRVTWDLLPALGVNLKAGRGFMPDEDRRGGPNAVLLSQGLWMSRFGGDPAVVGRSIQVNGVDRIIVGIAPSLPSSKFGPGAQRGILLPLALPEDQRQVRAGGFLRMVARLKTGSNAERLDQELKRIEDALPHDLGSGRFIVRARPMRDALTEGFRSGLVLQGAAMAFLLLIACANVANMLLARGIERRREMAIRAAMGAGRARIISQLLVESSVLGLLGGLAGLLLGRVLLNLLVGILPPHPALGASIPLVWSTVAVTLLLGILSSLLFGILPAIGMSRDLEAMVLKQGRSATPGQSRLRNGLVIAEITLATAMLLCAGLMVRSLSRLEAFHPGFDPRGVLCAEITPLPGVEKPQPGEALVRRISAIPGVRSVGQSWSTPAEVGSIVNAYWVPGQEELDLQASCNGVGPGYFATLGIRFREGRTFMPGERNVVIVNESLARRHWPGQSAIGKTLRSQCPGEGRTDQTPLTIVGVIEDLHQKMPGAPIYSLTYFPDEKGWLREIKVDGNPMSYAASLERAVAEVAPGFRISRLEPLASKILEQSRDARAKGTLLSVYALVALLLAAVGIYGVMAFSVGQRRREIGIRMALGSQISDILTLILARGLKLAILGTLMGVAAGLALGRAMASELFTTSPADPLSLVSSAALLLIVALIACLIPALRAARVDPSIALRSE